MSNSKRAQTAKVVIIGGGFAGLSAAQQLGGKSGVDVTLVDRRNFHLFQPLLYQVATGELSPSNIASPIRGILRRHKNAKVVLGEVDGFDLPNRQVNLEGRHLDFDYLIVAAGSTHHYFGNDHWEDDAPGLKTVEDATEIRRRVLEAFERAEVSEDPAEIASLLTFVIVGGGPTGCELAGALAEVAHRTMVRDFRRIDTRKARILLIEPTEKPLGFYPAPLPKKAEDALHHLGVEIISGFRVTDVQRNYVEIQSNDETTTEQIQTKTAIWAAGVRGSSLGNKLAEQAGVETGKGGRIPVQNDCSIASDPTVFVCGDLAIFDDEARGELPCLAPVAGQMGRHAADCILRDLRQRDRKPFKYLDKGSLAVIGRYHAVGTIGSWRLHGLIAWAIWLLVHLMYITRFRNRVLVLVQWGWAFLMNDRSSRLITNNEEGESALARDNTESNGKPGREETLSV